MVVKNTTELKLAISALEKEKTKQKEMIAEQLSTTYKSLTPANFIYTTLAGITQSPKWSELLVDTGSTIAASVASAILPQKKLFGIQVKTIKKVADKLYNIGKDSIETSVNEIKTSTYQMCNRFFDKILKS